MPEYPASLRCLACLLRLCVPLLLVSCARQGEPHWREYCNELAGVYRDDPGFLDFCVKGMIASEAHPAAWTADGEEGITIRDGDTLILDGRRYTIRQSGDTIRLNGKRYRAERRGSTITVKKK